MTVNTLKLIHEYLTQGGYSSGIDSEALEREATLIAAAPDLLAALQEMVALFADHAQYDDEGHELAAVTAAQSAIAKATGEA